MYSAKVESGAAAPDRASELEVWTAKWRDWPASKMAHHGKACCDIARHWTLAFDRSQLGSAATLTGPRWLGTRYPWGPSAWPMYWCDAVEAKQLDCGVHAALANELFTDRGLTSFPVQFVEQYDAEAGGHWTEKWSEGDVAARWIDGERVYHEGCAVLIGHDEVKLWDASAGWWVDPKQNQGYGAVLAVRILDEAGKGPAAFGWAGRRLTANQWVRL